MNLSRDDSKQKVFMEFYDPCHDAFSRYCRGITSSADDAWDLAGEAILIVFENLENLRKKDSFKSYLFGVARRLRLNQYRREKFHGAYNEDDVELINSYTPSPDLNPDVDLLYDYLDKLPLKQKETFLLFELSGFSMKEIQKMHGGTLSGVKTRLKRAREQLRLWLDDEVNVKSNLKRKEDNNE